MNPAKLIEKSRHSKFHLWLLNVAFQKMIPFNKPHKFKVTRIEKGSVEVKLPYLKKNHNHIKGLHACAIATLAEFCTGLTLITSLDPKAYRIIMQKLEMEYFYQGKTEAVASCAVTEDWLEENVLNVIANGTPATVTCQTDILDRDQNKLATGNITWQVKAWENVQTKL